MLQVQHTYLKPVVHPATVVIELYASQLGRSSAVLEHRLTTLEDPDALLEKAPANWSGSTMQKIAPFPCLSGCVH